jgi:hypothetical protein
VPPDKPQAALNQYRAKCAGCVRVSAAVADVGCRGGQAGRHTVESVCSPLQPAPRINTVPWMCACVCCCCCRLQRLRLQQQHASGRLQGRFLSSAAGWKQLRRQQQVRTALFRALPNMHGRHLNALLPHALMLVVCCVVLCHAELSAQLSHLQNQSRLELAAARSEAQQLQVRNCCQPAAVRRSSQCELPTLPDC